MPKALIAVYLELLATNVYVQISLFFKICENYFDPLHRTASAMLLCLFTKVFPC